MEADAANSLSQYHVKILFGFEIIPGSAAPVLGNLPSVGDFALRSFVLPLSVSRSPNCQTCQLICPPDQPRRLVGALNSPAAGRS
jgi:hypothetical protein